MSKATFLFIWLSLFFIPLLLALLDRRMFVLPIGFLLFEIWRMWTHPFGVEWVPSPQRIVEKMLKLGKVSRNDIVYDLGSGDGRIVISAAKLGARAIGVELDFLRVLIGRIKIKLARLENKARIDQGDFYKADVKNATVVTLFLLPKTMEKIENKLKKELRKGARVVSYRFVFKDWEPAKIDEENKIYLYKI